MTFNVIVVGCGGTGSAFLQKLARYQAASDANIIVTIIDGEKVERKNLKRQMFFEDSIGEFKAKELANLAADCYGEEWNYVPEYLLDTKLINKINSASTSYQRVDILVGCVDNHAARRVMESWFDSQNNCIYIDSANDEYDGEVVVAVKAGGMEISPRRSHYFKDVLTDDSPSVVEESCEVRNQSSPQHQCTNDLAANIVMSVVSQIFENKVCTGLILFNVKDLMIRRFPFESGDEQYDNR